MPTKTHAESNDAATPRGVQYIDQAVKLCDGQRLTSARGYLIDQKQRGPLNAEDRYGSTAGICCKKKRMVLAQRKRALRLERVGNAPAAATARGIAIGLIEVSIRRLPVGNHFISV